MALLWWIDAARNGLRAASNSYAEIQKQLNRYNKIFETYAIASPETQMRAASVMRQALDEYNGLKRQQEENTIRIYEFQNWVDYYNRNPQQAVPIQQKANLKTAQADVAQAAPTELIPIAATTTPWTLNNNTPTTDVEVNAIDTNSTMNVTSPAATVQNYINPTAPVWVTNIINSQTPKYPNTTISPVAQKTNNITWPNYWPGSVVPTPWTWGIARLNTTAINTKRSWNRFYPVARRILTGLYNYLRR